MLEIFKNDDRNDLNRPLLRTKRVFGHEGQEASSWTCFGDLRAIDEFWLSPNAKRSVHGESDAEIVTYLVKGHIEHRDDLGSGFDLQDGDVTCMRAGAGNLHVRRNLLQHEPSRELQISIFTETDDLPANFEWKGFPICEKLNRMRTIASPDGRGNSVRIRSNNSIYASILEARHEITYSLSGQRKLYVHVAQGKVVLNGQALNEGDGAKILDEMEITLTTVSGAEFLLFDLVRRHPL